MGYCLMNHGVVTDLGHFPIILYVSKCYNAFIKVNTVKQHVGWEIAALENDFLTNCGKVEEAIFYDWQTNHC